MEVHLVLPTTSRAPVASQENLLPTTSTCCLLRLIAYYEYLAAYHEYLAASREHAAYTHLLDFATCSKIYLSQRIL